MVPASILQAWPQPQQQWQCLGPSWTHGVCFSGTQPGPHPNPASHGIPLCSSCQAWLPCTSHTAVPVCVLTLCDVEVLPDAGAVELEPQATGHGLRLCWCHHRLGAEQKGEAVPCRLQAVAMELAFCERHMLEVCLLHPWLCSRRAGLLLGDAPNNCCTPGCKHRWGLQLPLQLYSTHSPNQPPTHLVQQVHLVLHQRHGNVAALRSQLVAPGRHSIKAGAVYCGEGDHCSARACSGRADMGAGVS